MDAVLASLTADFSRAPGDPTALIEAGAALRIAWPADYAAFMAEQDGGSGWIGSAYAQLWPASELIAMNEEARVSDFAPNLVLFGSDGAGEAFAFDRASTSITIVMVPLVGLEPAIVQGSTLLELLQRVRDNRLFDEAAGST